MPPIPRPASASRSPEDRRSRTAWPRLAAWTLLPLAAAAALLAASPGALAAPQQARAGGEAAMVAAATALRDRALGDEAAYAFVRDLTTEIGARPAGSAADKAAVAWAAERLREMGFDRVWTEEVTVPHWVRGEESGAILDPFPVEVKLAALGGSVGTPQEGVTAEVVMVEDVESLAALPEGAVAGKIVFFDARMERGRTGAGYGQTVAIRSIGAREASRRGAVAAVIRSVGTGPHRFPHTGGTRYTEDDRVTQAVKPIPVAALALPDADILARRVAAAAQAGEPVRFHLELGARELPEEVSANVIAELTGRERPEEIVLLGCHLDSWDLGVGAVDDGSGCGIVAAAARQIAALPQRPRRSVRVVLFANEEFGLSGALAYAERHAEELPRHVLAFESDLGADRVWRFATSVADGEVAAYAPLAAVLAPLGIEHQGNTARGGADLIPLRRAGRPVADLTQDATRYFDVHHTDDDTMAMIDPEAVAQNVAAYATLAWWAAEHPAELGAPVLRE